MLGLGLVFFGLHYMGEVVSPLKENADFMRFMAGLERPLAGVAAGAVATIAIQSSSALLGIVITLAGQGLITLPAGLAVRLGTEIGTWADTLVASIGRTRAAVRAGLFHLGFNIICVAVGVPLIVPRRSWVSSAPSSITLARNWRGSIHGAGGAEHAARAAARARSRRTYRTWDQVASRQRRGRQAGDRVAVLFRRFRSGDYCVLLEERGAWTSSRDPTFRLVVCSLFHAFN